MNKAERAALTALLDDVAKGYTTKQAECHTLRHFLQRTQPKIKAPAANSVFDPAALDAANTYLAPISIPDPLVSARIHWTNKMGLVMTAEDIIKRPTDRVRPWAYTWVALAAKVKTDALAKKAKAK